MNTSLVKNTKTLQLPFFPVLPPNKSNAVLTKHFTNCALYLPADLVGLLSWLVYQCAADNTIVYNTQLLHRYCKSVYEANKQYNTKYNRKSPNGLKASLTGVRISLIKLIERGYIIRISNDKMLINPMLSWYEYLSRKEYNAVMAEYQAISADEGLVEFCKKYINLVNKKIHG